MQPERVCERDVVPARRVDIPYRVFGGPFRLLGRFWKSSKRRSSIRASRLWLETLFSSSSLSTTRSTVQG